MQLFLPLSLCVVVAAVQQPGQEEQVNSYYYQPQNIQTAVATQIAS